jgi:hypothetical protein
MSEIIRKLRYLAKSNFCEKCYPKGQIENLLSEPLVDWKETEINIDKMWIKAKGFYKVINSTIFSPDKDAFQKAKETKLHEKLKFLKDKGMLYEDTYKFLDQVSKRRNKIHPQYSEKNYFSGQDYLLFQKAKALTGMIVIPIMHDLKGGVWNSTFSTVENLARTFLEDI